MGRQPPARQVSGLAPATSSTGGSTQDTFVQYFYDEQDRLRSEERTARIALNPTGWRDIAGRVPSERPLAAVLSFLGGVILLLIAPLLIARGLLAVGWVAQRRRMWHGRPRPCSVYISRRVRRRRLIALSVLAYIGPLFALDPLTVDRWFGDWMIRSAYADECGVDATCVAYRYEYDSNGNLAEKWTDPDGTAGPQAESLTARYVYDAENRLIVSDPSPGDADYSDVAVYRYAYDGIRVGKSVGPDTFRYIVDRNRAFAQVLEERRIEADDGDPQTVDETVVARYTHGDDLISQERFDANGDPIDAYYYHYDGQMSVRQVTDSPAVGDASVVNQYRYDSFGSVVAADTSETVANEFKYTGEQYDANSGYYYLRARYYAPGIGRFVSRDPFAGSTQDPTSLHKYLYADVDPVAKRDPSGLITIPELQSVISIMSRVFTIVGRAYNVANNVSRAANAIELAVGLLRLASRFRVVLKMALDRLRHAGLTDLGFYHHVLTREGIEEGLAALQANFTEVLRKLAQYSSSQTMRNAVIALGNQRARIVLFMPTPNISLLNFPKALLVPRTYPKTGHL